MSVRDWFRRALSRFRGHSVVSDSDELTLDAEDNSLMSPEMRQKAEAWLAAADAGLLDPPREVHDRGKWDAYWINHLKFGVAEHRMFDLMLVSDPELPALLHRRGARTVLCVGNGMSGEPFALGAHGFHVTALDLSSVPAEAFANGLADPEHPARRIPGSDLLADGSLSFGPGPIAAELCPSLHRSKEQAAPGGGSVCFVTGDLRDPQVCPGPFDVIVERRTLQLFQGADQAAALRSLLARFADRATFISHEHSGAWRPGQSRKHFAEAVVRSSGFVLWYDAEEDKRESAALLAKLLFSSG